MKKIIIVLSMVLMLVGCGSNTSQKGNAQEDATNKKSEESVSSDIYFKDNEVKTKDLKIKITETKVIPAGEMGNEYGEKPVLAIWYDVTNLSDKEIDPSTAWIAIFTAIQDNDPNAINELEVGMLPDEAHMDSQLEIIKKDGTVGNSIAYGLDDLETPVTLVATQGILGDEIGRKDFEVK